MGTETSPTSTADHSTSKNEARTDPYIKVGAERKLARLLTVRPMEPGDEPLVFSSWLKSFRGAVRMPKTDFYTYYHAQVELIMSRPDVLVTCAVAPSDPSMVLGWLCSERTPSFAIVHYAYTKDIYRKQGILWLLLKHACIGREDPIIYTYQSKGAKKVAPLFSGSEYVPAGEYLA